MLHFLKRHPVPISAFFERCLVLAYAFPAELLAPLLPPGLVLDTFEDCGFLAVALVQTRHLRPSFLPAWTGQSFFLSGYRLFTRLGSETSALRGLYILRSDTDRLLMTVAGNLLTHYHYTLSRIHVEQTNEKLTWIVRTPNAVADLTVTADLASRPPAPPAGSPFSDFKNARRFAGPLPYTFDFERQTRSIISVRGFRPEWNPQPVSVHVEHVTFLDKAPFNRAQGQLASAFYLHSIPYRWERGRQLKIHV